MPAKNKYDKHTKAQLIKLLVAAERKAVKLEKQQMRLAEHSFDIANSVVQEALGTNYVYTAEHCEGVVHITQEPMPWDKDTE